MTDFKGIIKRAYARLNPLYVFVPAALLISALLIRLFSGGSVPVLTALADRGIFPSPFLYAVGYMLRIVLAGILTAYTLTHCFCHSTVLRIAAAVMALLLLSEYKLIFVSVRLFSSLVISCICAALSVYLLLKMGKTDKTALVLTALMSVCQILFCLQTVSLILSV